MAYGGNGSNSNGRTRVPEVKLQEQMCDIRPRILHTGICAHPEAEVFLGAVKTAKYVTPGDTRLGESLLPYVKDSNTILLQNHGTVTFDVDLEGAYYKLEIVDAYSRILLLAKQIGSIRPLDAEIGRAHV